MIVALAGLFGLVTGSFLNVCIYRWPRDLSVLRPQRSFCPSCEKTIAAYDNIPVLSYLILRGKCRQCGAAISIRYPVVEAVTAAMFAVIVAMFGPTIEAVKFAVFAAVMIGLLFSDLEERILPDELTKGGTAIGLLFALAVPMPIGWLQLLFEGEWNWRMISFAESLAGAASFSGVLWATGAVYRAVRGREGLGAGDIKMVAAMGAFLGMSESLFALLTGSLLGSVTGIIYMKAAKLDPATYELPFGTFLGIGGLVAIFHLALGAFGGS